jgi:arsenite methyltransferase
MSISSGTPKRHELSDSQWLDSHFECARGEYEAALREAGVKRGGTVLDAGCGSGGFLPVLCELVGPEGSIMAVDLALENVELVEAKIDAGILPPNTRVQVGDVLGLPFADSIFDHVWNANVAQYLTDVEFGSMMSEFKRVSKPGAFIAVKEFDSSIMQLHPRANDFVRRIWARRQSASKIGQIGAWGGTTIPSLMRSAGLINVTAKGWLVERWAPITPATRDFLEKTVQHWMESAVRFELPISDQEFWKELAADPSVVLDDADFCYREFFVVAIGQVPP